MDAHNFVSKLKANGTENDWCDLQQAFDEYHKIISKLSASNRSSFSLNVLCILCRNIDKVISWRECIDNKSLLLLSIDCVRETRQSERLDRVKALACIYHIHKHVVKQNHPQPPELVLKISYMPYENDVNSMLNEYAKTYWNILADRITYFEKLKLSQRNTIKLLPKLIEDIQKVIQIYDTVPFCSNILPFIIKKMHYLYSESHSKDINTAFGQIFECLARKNDLKAFKELKSDESLDIYSKLNDCLYVIVENSMKFGFKGMVLNAAVRSCMNLLSQNTDLFHCLQTFYLNSFCCMFTSEGNSIFLESILNGLLISCQTTEKLGYEKAMKSTYPFIYQLLRIYIEYTVNNCKHVDWKENFTDTIQEICLKLIAFLITKLKYCKQMLKCDGCHVKTGQHDALRLSFLAKNFVTISQSQGISLIKILPLYQDMVTEQHHILVELRALGCKNYDKCYRKLQTDIHNVAISLNKAQYFESSINLFNIYLKNELAHFKSELDLKNISRALYNKSICELDDNQHENALINAYLSLIFAFPDSLHSEKHMSLVMDIKAKSLKHKAPENDEDEVKNDNLQLTSVFEAIESAVDSALYENLKPFVKHLKFSELLKHEFAMYAKLWPSIVPVGGVWRSLLRLCKGEKPEWLAGEPAVTLCETLYDIILQTAMSVRTIHCDYYATVVAEMLDKFDKETPMDIELTVVHATLLSFKCEYNLAEASQKYGWKTTDPNSDAELSQCSRTLALEYQAMLPAFKCVDLWTEIVKNIDKVPSSALVGNAIKIASITVQELAHCQHLAPALHLAYICCRIADKLKDNVTLQQNMSVILSHCRTHCPVIEPFVKWCKWSEDRVDTRIEYICDVALYYNRCGKVGVAATLLRLAQAKIVETMQRRPNVNLDLAIGRLMCVQLQLTSGGQSILTLVNTLQRHYLSVANDESTWCLRRARAVLTKRHLSLSTRICTSVLNRLSSWQRARAAASSAGNVCSASDSASVVVCCVNVCDGDDAQVKIDNRLKHILGLATNESQQNSSSEPIKEQMFTPKHNNLETMLDSGIMFKKTQISPSLPCVSIPGFKTPHFLKHGKDCSCNFCNTPQSLDLTLRVLALEAAVYFRAKELDIAKNYFDGVLNMFGIIEIKFKDVFARFKTKYKDLVVEIAKREYENDFKKTQVEILLQAAYFELSQGHHEKADDYIVRTHELVQECEVDKYLSVEIMHLMVTSAQMRTSVTKQDLTDLETEMDNLKLTPTKVDADPPKTPETKAPKPPKNTDKKIVLDEEIPKLKRKVIKLNLNDDSETPESKPKPSRSRPVFKIPVPVTSKPVPETISNTTPKPKSKVNILITQASQDTPKQNTTNQEFFTPNETPAEKFFTPLTSIKTYSKQTLRQNIVKNLEHEFGTPKVEKENSSTNIPVPKTSKAKVAESKRTLKRATSPGKLGKDERKAPLTRTRRMQRPNVNLSVEEDN